MKKARTDLISDLMHLLKGSMKKNIRNTAVLLAFVAIGCSSTQPVAIVPPPPPPPATPLVDHAAQLSMQGADAVLWQNTSAEAYRLFQQGYELARLKLDANLAKQKAVKSTEPFAVVVDVDETVLDNSPYQVELVKKHTVYDQDSWKQWTDKANAKACPGALEFLTYAKGAGCEVFYITNRDKREQASTLKNLNDLGFPNSDAKHLLLMEGTSDKTDRRAKVDSTHRIVLFVGDQLRDFDEGFKDRKLNYGKGIVDSKHDTLMQYFILLPNPMYGTYRDAVQGKGSDMEKQQQMDKWFQENGY